MSVAWNALEEQTAYANILLLFNEHFEVLVNNGDSK